MINTSYSKIVLILFFTLIIALFSTLVYNQIFNTIYKMNLKREAGSKLKVTYIERYPSDMSEHIKFIDEFIKGEKYIPHPLWHISAFSFSKILNRDEGYKYGAFFASIFYLMLWLFLIYYLVNGFLPDSSIYLQIFITFTIFMIGPLNIPWYSTSIYRGVGSPNIWHNVTLWTVKPFALLSLLFTIDGLEKKSKKYLTLAIVFSTISIFAKPNFIIMFLPALVFLFFYEKRYRDKLSIIFFLTLLLISISILLYQYTHTFGGENSHIVIDFFSVWMISSPNIPLSIILALAFPIFFTMLNTESLIKNRYILISWVMVLIGIIYYSSFAQTGRFYFHGNFGWSYMIALSILYLFSIIEFFKLYPTLNWYKKYPLLALLIFQLIVGIVYFYGIFKGENPLFVSIF